MATYYSVTLTPTDASKHTEEQKQNLIIIKMHQE